MISFPQRTKSKLPGSLLDVADEALPEGSLSCHLQAQPIAILMTAITLGSRMAESGSQVSLPTGCLSLYFQQQRPVSYLTESENWSQGSEC